MRKATVVGITFIGILGVGLALAILQVPTCQTETITRISSADLELSAEYENAQCESDQGRIAARVYLIPSSRAASSKRLVFQAYGEIDKGLSRKTQRQRLSISWGSDKSLGIKLLEPLNIDESVDTNELPIKLRIELPSEVVRSTMQASAKDILDLLASSKLVAESDRLQEMIYSRFGSGEVWPIVDAVWRGDIASYPSINWEATRNPRLRILFAAVWGQWRREHFGSAGDAELAAEYVRGILRANDPALRLVAISALGAVGSTVDIAGLGSLISDNDEQTAMRAASALFAIERKLGRKPSSLESIRPKASTTVAAHIDKLLAQTSAGSGLAQ